MPRVLVAAGSVLAVILPVTVLALGLGEINLKSALNQPFLAEIPLTTSASEDPGQVKVALAPAATFERYGLVQPQFMNDFSFQVLTDQGRPRIRVSSTGPVVEPFVTMLIEISWPQGRLLREFTVLLDPPVFQSPAAAVTSPGPAVSGQRDSAVVRPAPAPRPQPAPAAVPRQAPLPAGGNYGPVERNDTLWGIAERVAPEGVDTNQMMLAIYRANPGAFGGNINRLRAGAILRVPAADEIAGLDRREAFAEVRRQNEAWRQGAAAPAASETPRLRLVPPPAESEQAIAGAGAGTGGAQSAADAARVAELEAEIAERERLLAIKDRELEALQKQLSAMGEQPAEAPVEAGEGLEAPFVKEPVGTEPETTPQVPVDSIPEAGETVGAEEPPAPSSMPPAVTSPQRSEPSFLGSLLGNIWLYVGIGLALLAALFVVGRRRRAEDSTGRWESLDARDDEQIDDETREATERLRASATRSEDTFVVEEVRPEATDALDEGSGTLQMDRSGDRELPLERTISSDAGLNLDQSDPIAEAEFHMAYGLYDQAADLLVNALKAEPGRRDLRRKLLDVYFVWENKGGFLREAQVFHDQAEAGDPDWNKVLIMGKQLCPDEDLFAAAAAPSNAGSDMDLDLFEGDAGGEDVDLRLGDEESGADVDLDLSAIREMPDGDMLDFDIGEAEVEESDFSPTARQDWGDSPTLETPTIETAGPSSPTVETPTLETPMSETTMETPTIETPVGGWDDAGAQGSSDQTAALDLDELGLDLSGFDLGSDDVDADDDEPASGNDDATMLASDLDDEALLRKVGSGLDLTAEVEALDAGLVGEDDLDGLLDADSTAEMRSMDEYGDGPDLEALTAAMEKSTGNRTSDTGDTLEQPKPAVEDTAEQPRPAGGSSADSADVDSGMALDFDIGEGLADEDSPTGTLGIGGRRPEGPTMTEVGTKLDLARAYVDMGDPEGARSILGEVIEEGDAAQRQQAQKLLEDLAD